MKPITILGINAYHPDAAAVILRGAEIIWAAEEERFNRIKHSSGFPSEAIKQGLFHCQISPREIDIVAVSKNPRAHLLKKAGYALQHHLSASMIVDRLKAFRKTANLSEELEKTFHGAESFTGKIIYVEHHLSHVASAYFYSGFDEAAILSIDGLGDFSSALTGKASGNQIKAIDRVFFPHSLGFFYTAATQFLGFPHFGDEYKVMGLAGYGKPLYVEAFREMIRLKPNGRFELNLAYFEHPSGRSKFKWDTLIPMQDSMYSELWVKKFGPPRMPDAAMTEREKNMAASLQAVLEETIFHMLNYLHRETGSFNLAIAGGVGFNGVANGKITRNTPFKQVFIQPAAGDSGTALGAAAYVYYQKNPEAVRTQALSNVCLGSFAREDDIVETLRRHQLPLHKMDADALCKKIAHAIDEGLVVGWFQGRMEFGPRALGNRSILADPRRRDMQQVLNVKIKHRETFRPFAPAVLEEKAKEYFDMDCEAAPFMIKVFPVKEMAKNKIPAVTHVDGTARVQTVSKQNNPLFWQLIKAFEARTGVPILLNTSFNEKEPIVCTAEEALQCYLKTQMDILVLGNYILER